MLELELPFVPVPLELFLPLEVPLLCEFDPVDCRMVLSLLDDPVLVLPVLLLLLLLLLLPIPTALGSVLLPVRGFC